MNNHGKRIALVALITLAASCSGGDKIVSPDTLNNNNTGPKKLSTEDSLYVVNQISSAAFASIKALRNITVPSLPGLGTSVPPAPCNPTVTGTTDTNGNGIPDNKLSTYTAANCSYPNNGTAVVVTGTVRLEDLGGTYGYRVTYTNFNTIGTKGDSTYKTLVNGTIEYAFTSTTQARTQDNLDITLFAGSSAGSASLQRVAGSLAGTFTPSNGNILSRTAPLPTGTLIMSGAMTVTATATGNQIPTGGPASQTVSMLISTTAPMNANIGCSLDQSLNSGGMQATVGGSQTGAASVTFTACGQGGTGPTTPSGGGKR